jgi:RNA polymerase sigma-70 factor (ECF subfamily)
VTLSPSTDELLQQTRWLQRLARALVADDALAADLVQDTVADALRQRPRGLRDLRAWLSTVLRRRAARLLRRERARPDVERRAARAEAQPAADDTVAQAMLHRDVVDAVLALDEPYRTAILLRYLRDLPPDEVARRTSAPVATVRSRIQRGLALLRSRLDRRHGSRAAWVALLGPAPFAATAVATASLLMHTKTLAAVLAAGLALATALWWIASPTAPAQPPIAAKATPAANAAVADSPVAAADAARARADAPTAVADQAARSLATGLVLDEETRAPLADVEVGWFATGRSAAAPRDAARTDATGRFELGADLADVEQRCAVLLRRRGYAWLTCALGKAAGAQPRRFDLGTILMPPGTSIAGRVVDRDGAPVADAALLYYDTLFFTAGGRSVPLAHPLAIGSTGADGTFAPEARLVPVQDAILIAASPRGLGWLPLPRLARSRTELRELVVVLLPACDLTVQVRDPQGRAIAGAAVLAEPQFPPLGASSPLPSGLERVPALRALFTATTDERGDARLPCLPTGRADGNLVLPAPPDGRTLGSYRLVVQAAGRVRVDLPRNLAPGPRTEPVVLAPPRAISVTGTVVDTGHHPLAGAVVAIDRDDALQVTTDGRGAFTLTAPSSNPFRVTATASGHQTRTENLALTDDKDSIEVELVLTPAASLTGVVVDERGTPVAGARVFAGDRPVFPTDSQGRFAVPDVPVGRSLSLQVLPPPPSSDWSGQLEFAVTTADSPITARLQRLAAGDCALTVELLDADGAPLEARLAILTRLTATGERMHQAQASIGRVTAQHLGPGQWRLLVQTRRGPCFVADFPIAAGELDHPMTMRQPRGATLEVEVVPEPAGLELPAELTIASGYYNPGRFTNSSGEPTDDRVLRLATAKTRTFHVVDIDPTRAFFLGTADEHVIGQLRFAAGALPARARLVVQAPARLRFVFAEPWPQHGLAFYLRRPGGAFDEPNRFEEMEGRTEFAGWTLAPGVWDWRVETLPTAAATAPRAWEGRVDVAAGGTVEAKVDDASRR